MKQKIPGTKRHRTTASQALEDAVGYLLKGPSHDWIDFASRWCGEHSLEIESAILARQHPWDIVEYVNNVRKQRWPEGEFHMLKCGEHYLHLLPDALVYYAQQVIKGRWPEGEEFIVGSRFEEEYAKTVLSGHWDEQVASKCTCWLYHYAKDEVEGQLPEELHNKMLGAFLKNKNDPWCKKYFAAKKYKKVRKPR
jgi:hypothetical protein